MNATPQQASRPVQQIVTRTARIWLEEDGIMRYQLLPNADDTLADIKDGVAAVWQISGERATPLLVDLNASRSVTKEARSYLAGDETARTTTAVALLVGSPISKIVGNFFLSINKPPFPIRLFRSETAALDWLRDFMP